MISIIIPVYNVRLYLARCIESVMAQTLSDWELILVDDGATDGSGALCDLYSRKDSRIRVFHQRNMGFLLLEMLDWIRQQGNILCLLMQMIGLKEIFVIIF